MLLCVPALSKPFWVFYASAGFSDMIDGTVARMTGSESEFGAKLDTLADMVFIIAVAWKLLPVIKLPTGIWIWVAVIAIIKVINVISGYVVQKRFVSVHSKANKVTGLMLFLLPFSFEIMKMTVSVAVVCAIATFAAVQEGHFIRTGRTE